MTTIITIVVVALVFFVTVCIVGLMVWKREAEMRTDSIKAIEHNVEEMLYELMGDSSGEVRRRIKRDGDFRSERDEPPHVTKDRHERDGDSESERKKNRDPFERVGAESDREKDFKHEGNAEAAEKAQENITIFDPIAVQYTSFDRGSDPSERDGKRGLKWKEIEEPQTVEAKQEEVRLPGSPEPPGPTELPESEPVEAKQENSPEPEPSTAGPPNQEAGQDELQAAEQPKREPETQQAVIEPEAPQAAIEPEAPQTAIEPEAPHTVAEEPEPQQTAAAEENTPGTEEDELLQILEQAGQPQEIQTAAAEPDEPRETDEGGRLSRLLKRHKKSSPQQEQKTNVKREQDEGPEQRRNTPEQEKYESIEDLLKDYISEPRSEYENRYETEPETQYEEPIKPGYDVGKSGRKYTAAELETLIKE